MYHSIAAEALSLVQGEIEELTVAAEAEYRFELCLTYPLWWFTHA
jgi:hypothetical protein